jgi:hypothetical protein
MSSRYSPWYAGVLLAVAPSLYAAPVPAGDPAAAFKPTLTVRLQAPDLLLADIRHVATLVARFAPSDKEAKQFIGATDEALDKTLGPDWRKAVDTSRPLLGYVTLDANLPASPGAVLVPVKDEAAFRKTLAALVGKLEDQKDGTLRFDFPGARSPDGAPVFGFVRFASQYAYITVQDASVIALNRLPAPAQVVAGDPAAGLSAKLILDRVPEQFRQMAVGGVQQFKGVVTGENAARGAVGLGGLELITVLSPLMQLYPLAEPAIRDGQELTMNFRFDRKQLNLLSEIIVTAKPGTELAGLVSGIKPSTSLFPQMVGSDAAARALIRATIPEDLRKTFVPKFEAGLREMPNGVRPAWATLIAKVGERLLPTLREGEIDLGAALRGPLKDDRYGIVVGLRLKDAPAVEQALRESVNAFPKEMQEMIKLDAATVAGKKVHEIRLPPLPEPMKTIFGEQPILIAFRPDAVVAAFGEGSAEALLAGLSAKPQPAVQSMADASGRKLVPLVTKIDSEAGKKFKTFLGDEIDRVPIVDMVVEGGSTLKIRYGNMLTSVMPMMFFVVRSRDAVGIGANAAAPVAVPARPLRPAVPAPMAP